MLVATVPDSNRAIHLSATDSFSSPRPLTRLAQDEECRRAGSEARSRGRLGKGALAMSVAVGETRVLKHFQERMPYGLFVPDVP
jgi:hypothetical protein